MLVDSFWNRTTPNHGNYTDNCKRHNLTFYFQLDLLKFTLLSGFSSYRKTFENDDFSLLKMMIRATEMYFRCCEGELWQKMKDFQNCFVKGCLKYFLLHFISWNNSIFRNTVLFQIERLLVPNLFLI